MLFTEIPLPIIAIFRDRCTERLDRMVGNFDATLVKNDNDSTTVNVEFNEYKSVVRNVNGMNNSGTRYLSLLKISVSLVVSVIFFASTYLMFDLFILIS